MDAKTQGNDYYGKGEYKTAVKWYSRGIEIYEMDKVLYSNRSAAYLKLAVEESNERAIELALEDAKKVVELDATWSKGHSRLGAAYYAKKDMHGAVRSYKKALEIDPENELIQDGLQRARIEILNDMITGGQQGDEEAEKDYNDASPLPTSETHFLGSSTVQITPQVVGRIVLLHTLEQLRTVQLVKPAAFAFGLGCACLLVTHLLKLVLLLGLCRVAIARGGGITQRVNVYIDKIQSIFVLPSVVFCLPILLGIYSQIKMFRFIHQDTVLSTMMFLTTLSVTIYGFWIPPEQRKDWWSRGRRLKLLCHLVMFVYWVILKQHHDEIYRLLAPLAMHTAAVLLQSIPPQELHVALRRGISYSVSEIVTTIQTDMQLDMWVFLGTLQWVVDYWQQPSTFTMTELVRMLNSSMARLQKGVTGPFEKEIQRMRSQFSNMEFDDDYHVLVAHIEKTVEDMPPSKSVAYTVISLRHCPSIIALIYLLAVNGIFVWSILPLTVHEVETLWGLIEFSTQDEFKQCDTIQLILHDSKLLDVWTNLKAGVYCLQCSISMTKAVATGSSACRIAYQLQYVFFDAACRLF